MRTIVRILILVCIMVAPLAAFAAEFHVNNSGTCSNSGPGSLSQPFCTVQTGIDHISGPGDTVVIHEGTYNECSSLANPAQSGTPSNPVVIKGADGEDPGRIIIDASGLTYAQCPAMGSNCDSVDHRAALTLKGNWSSSLSSVRVQNLTVRPPAFETASRKNSGISIQCAEKVELIGIRSDQQPAYSGTSSTLEGGADAIVFAYSSKDILVEQCQVSNGGVIREGFHAFALQGGTTNDVGIFNCNVKDLKGGFILQSGGVNRVTAAFNDVSHIDGYADGDNVIQVYNIDNLSVMYNRIVDHDGYIARLRSYDSSTRHPKVLFANNYFRARSSGQSAIDVGYAASQDAVELAVFKSNLFEGYSRAYHFRATRIDGCDFRQNYDGFYSVSTPLVDDSGCGFSLGSGSQILSTDPLNASDCPVSGSPTVDGGDPTYSTPSDGSASPDIGACERGEATGGWVSPYDFSPMDSTSDSTPAITWDGLNNSNVNLKNLDFKHFLKGNPQSSYRCQVDSRYTFNSAGIATPLWDSGRVSSAASSCTVGQALADGVYFARVRQNDLAWSGYFRFEVGDGGPPPPPEENPADVTGVTRSNVKE